MTYPAVARTLSPAPLAVLSYSREAVISESLLKPFSEQVLCTNQVETPSMSSRSLRPGRLLSELPEDIVQSRLTEHLEFVPHPDDRLVRLEDPVQIDGGSRH